MGDYFKVLQYMKKRKEVNQELAHELDMRCGFRDCQECYPEQEKEEPEELNFDND